MVPEKERNRAVWPLGLRLRDIRNERDTTFDSLSKKSRSGMRISIDHVWSGYHAKPGETHGGEPYLPVSGAYEWLVCLADVTLATLSDLKKCTHS